MKDIKGKNSHLWKEPIKIICSNDDCKKEFFVKPRYKDRKFCCHKCHVTGRYNGHFNKHHSEESKMKIRNSDYHKNLKGQSYEERINNNIIQRIKKEASNRMKGNQFAKGRIQSKKEKKLKSIARKKYILNHGGINNIGKFEKQVLDKIENLTSYLSFINEYKIKRQYHIKGTPYKVDGYIPELNLVIEIDEPQHYINGKIRKKDIIRKNIIKNKIKCEFIRMRINKNGTVQ